MRRVLVPAATSPALPVPGSVVLDLRGESMGTTWSVRLVDTPDTHPATHWQQQIQQQLDTVVAQMSHWLADSDLDRFNRAPAGSWQTLPEAFFQVLSYALSVAKASDGAYDPTAGALVNVWGFGPTGRYDQPDFRAPDAQTVEDARQQGGWQHLAIDADSRKVCQPGGVLLDLSAVAKGYGVDRVAQYLESMGIAHYLVEVGGELRGAGVKPDQLPWWVALEQPPSPAQAASETIIALHGLAIATSGDYRRFFGADRTRYAHTIDPRNGYPIRNGLASVTVLHPSCMAADALSTALTVLGVEDGLVFAEEQRLAARFLVRKGNHFVEYVSRGFTAMLQ